MTKSPAMQSFIDEMTQKLFGRKTGDGVCVACGSQLIQHKDFKDELSYKEYTISRMCQKCQDGVFNKF